MEKTVANMRAMRKTLVFATIAGLFVSSQCALAGRMKLRITAVNPLDETKPYRIQRDLPARVSTNDIISLGGMSLGYDVKKDAYYVFEEVQLAPRGTPIVREIEINDIWILDEEELKAVAAKAQKMGSMLSGTKYAAKAAELVTRVDELIQAAIDSQEENSVARVSAIRHIQAYEPNRQLLQEARQGLGKLENFALAAGLSPGDELSGDDQSAAKPRRDVHFPQEYGEAVYRITIVNDSAVLREANVRQVLPKEVIASDILDPADLDVSTTREGVVLAKRKVEVEANSRVEFKVRIRDKWNINAPRIEYLHAKGEELKIITTGRKRIEAVANTIEKALSDLERIANEEGPTTFNAAYVAFYRRQANDLDGVEAALNRIEAAIRPLETKKGFDIPAPDQKTTWIIIYSILGFLALVSLLFFLRWFVKSGSESS